MQKQYVSLLAVIILLGITVGAYHAHAARRPVRNILLKNSITVQELKDAYASSTVGGEKIKILIVPGHDDDFSGTQFNGLRELDLNLELSNYLYEFLKEDGTLTVLRTQTHNGYTAEFADYFKNEADTILAFREEHADLINAYEENGAVERKVIVDHVTAPAAHIIRLYGINKWANENGVDAVIHIHFNDDPARHNNQTGKYNGFSIYIPEKQYRNSATSRAIAQEIFTWLSFRFPVSNLPGENLGIVPEQQLIAIGANNSLEAAGLLIEFDYVYESQLHDTALRAAILKESAFQTYLGIRHFFSDSIPQMRVTTLLPHTWHTDIHHGVKKSLDVLKLQMALTLNDVYPPRGFTKNDCPLNGNFLGCGESAIKAFQIKYGITPASGIVGPQTRAKLNELFSG